MSLHLQRQIGNLKTVILRLGALVEEAVAAAIDTVETRGGVQAQQVIDRDTAIDKLEIDVEEECLHTLALYQPVAFDLRFVVAVLKINNDLERIADLAVNVAQQTRFLGQQPGIDLKGFDVHRMGAVVRQMLKQSLDALVNIDPELAEKVRRTDDEVDAMHRENYRQVKQAIRADVENVDSLINVLFISRNLERIADHAVNIADDVLYMAKGDILRHSRPHTADAKSA